MTYLDQINIYKIVEEMRDRELSRLAFHKTMYQAFTAILDKMEAEAGYQSKDQSVRNVPWGDFAIQLTREIAPCVERMNSYGEKAVDLDDIMRTFLSIASYEYKIPFDTRAAKTGIGYAVRKAQMEQMELSNAQSESADESGNCRNCPSFSKCFPCDDEAEESGETQNDVLRKVASLIESLGIGNAVIIFGGADE